MLKLNIGCGPVQPDGWINIDGSNRAWLASRIPPVDSMLVRLRLLPQTEYSPKTYYLNVLKGLPFEDSCVHAVYCGEVLEHFTLPQAEHLIRDILRVLAPRGVLRVRVPDNYRFWRNYVSEFDKEMSKPLEDRVGAHTRWVEMFFRDICVKRTWLGSYGHFHKWMFDELSLESLFRNAGFEQIERKSLFDSRITDVKLVETHEDLTMEGVKPVI